MGHSLLFLLPHNPIVYFNTLFIIHMVLALGLSLFAASELLTQVFPFSLTHGLDRISNAAFASTTSKARVEGFHFGGVAQGIPQDHVRWCFYLRNCKADSRRTRLERIYVSAESVTFIFEGPNIYKAELSSPSTIISLLTIITISSIITIQTNIKTSVYQTSSYHSRIPHSKLSQNHPKCTSPLFSPSP